MYENPPFYRRKFKEAGITPIDIKSIEDLRKIPFTMKEDERKMQESVVKGMELGEHQCVQTKDIVRIHSSSGTTGKPVYFGLTHHDLSTWIEGMCRAFYALGIRPEDIVMYGWGLEMFVGGFLL